MVYSRRPINNTTWRYHLIILPLVSVMLCSCTMQKSKAAFIFSSNSQKLWLSHTAMWKKKVFTGLIASEKLRTPHDLVAFRTTLSAIVIAFFILLLSLLLFATILQCRSVFIYSVFIFILLWRMGVRCVLTTASGFELRSRLWLGHRKHLDSFLFRPLLLCLGIIVLLHVLVWVRL